MSSSLLSFAGLHFDIHRAIDLSIPVRFGNEQLSAFGAAPASSEPYRVGEFVGDVCAGSSCNCSTLHFTPHCHGTHTESVGHISREPWPVNTLGQALYLAQLVSLTPEVRADGDTWITHAQLKAQLQQQLMPDVAIKALVLRTLPNHTNKRQANYAVDGHTMPTFFEPAALALLAAQSIEHLLVDLPSVDRLADDGKLLAHRAFWGLPTGHSLATATRPHATITELIYVPDAVPDGRYLLNLNIACISADAAPSRPLLYPIHQ